MLNKVKFDGLQPNPEHSIRTIKLKVLSTFFQTNIRIKKLETSSSSHCWSPSPIDYIKLNVDAFLVAMKATTRVIARDNRGIPKVIWMGSIQATSLEEVELQAILRALRIVEIEGWRSIIVEGDSKLLLDALAIG